MVLNNVPQDVNVEYECDETFDENKKNPRWPFASEDDEHLHFDNLQRARDIRSS